MNPYAPALGERVAREVLPKTAWRLSQIVEKASPERLEHSPAPGKWSIREILCHLADTEMVFAFRLRQTLAEPHHLIQPFDQDLWAQSYRAYDVEAALAVFTAVRAWNVRLIDNLAPEAFSKTVTHPERGDMTFQTIFETMAGHDLHHLKQIEALV